MLPILAFAVLVAVTLFIQFRPDRTMTTDRLDGSSETVSLPRSRYQPIKWTIIGLVTLAWLAIWISEH